MSLITDNLHISLDKYKNRQPAPGCKFGGKRLRGVPADAARTNQPLVSIITVVYNNERNLAQAIDSVLAQTYANIEHIIIDGGSTDGTLDIIERYDDQIAYWTNEKDFGISDAFNKGVALANGEFIGILNADDWMSSDQVERGVQALLGSDYDFAFGDMVMHDPSGIPKYRIFGDPGYARIIESKMPELNHPTVLARRSAYSKIGGFNTAYKCAMDYDWMLRLHRSGGKGIYVKDIIGHMRESGVSDRFFINALKEVRNIAICDGQIPGAANVLFGYRVLKGLVRRSLERWAPDTVYRFARRLINPRFSHRL